MFILDSDHHLADSLPLSQLNPEFMTTPPMTLVVKLCSSTTTPFPSEARRDVPIKEPYICQAVKQPTQPAQPGAHPAQDRHTRLGEKDQHPTAHPKRTQPPNTAMPTTAQPRQQPSMEDQTTDIFYSGGRKITRSRRRGLSLQGAIWSIKNIHYNIRSEDKK